MTHLYEISAELRTLLEAIAEAEGEVTPEQDQSLDDLHESLTAKVDGICGLIRELESSAEAVDSEVKRLTKRRDAYRNKARRLRQYLTLHLSSIDVDSVKTTRFGVTLRRPALKVSVSDPYRVPTEFVCFHPRPDKKMLRGWLEAGNLCEGAELVMGEPGVTIR